MKKHSVVSALLAVGMLAGSFSSAAVLADDQTGGGPGGSAPQGTPPDGVPGGSGGSSSAVTSWDAVKEYSSDTEESDGTYDSTGTDENAIHVSGGNVVLHNSTITRTSSESSGGDNSSFYGVGAAVLTTDGTSYIDGGTITTNANGAAGVFAYSNGTAYAGNTTISTSGDTAGGIHVAGGGKLYAYNLNVTTQGESSAAIRSDRGGGTMVVDGGSYTTNGTGSPAVYVTADVTAANADLTANNSEGVCIEGLNTLRLFNSNLTSSMQDLSQNDSTWSVILYQSMSGDSEVGSSSFYMVDGSLDSKNGGLFYTTNTESNFYLENVKITQSDDAEYFLRVSGNNNQRGWGTSGYNGAQTNFTANDQEMKGDVIWDSISTLDFYMENGSTITGAVVDDETYAGSGGSGYANLYIDSGSTWIVTGDSTVTNLYNAGTIRDADGNTVTIKGTDGTVYVQGTSSYTITVSSYSTTVDMSGVISGVSYDDYKLAAPSQLASVTTTAVSTASASASATASSSTETASTKVSVSAKTIIVIAAVAAAAGLAVYAVMHSRKNKS
ncbi:MAG: hypothetical protein ACI316_09280 [Lactimicrobium massiliense]